MAPDGKPLADLSLVEVFQQAQWAYLHDVQFHHLVDSATVVWWTGMPIEHQPLLEYRQLGKEAIIVALWYERLRRDDADE